MDNKNTLHTTISRYLKKGILNRIHRGFYATVPLSALEPVALGIGHLHTFSYLSCETVLCRHGVLNQPVIYITFVSTKSEKFTIENNHYLARQMKAEYLYNSVGITLKNGCREASLERAVADLRYFNPRIHFDAPSLVDWDEVALIRKEVGY